MVRITSIRRGTIGKTAAGATSLKPGSGMDDIVEDILFSVGQDVPRNEHTEDAEEPVPNQSRENHETR